MFIPPIGFFINVHTDQVYLNGKLIEDEELRNKFKYEIDLITRKDSDSDSE